MKLVIIICGITTFPFVKAQNNYPEFPKDQHSYLGAYPLFYSDFHKFIVEKNLQPCANKKELSLIPILIISESKAKVMETDSLDLRNKCTIELVKNVIKYLDKWMPAKIDGKETPAVKKIPIYPDDLFEKYTPGYSFAEVDYKNTDFNIDDFRKKVVKYINLDNFKYKGSGKLTVITSFDINYKGKLDNLKIEQSSGSQRFDEMIIDAIKETQQNKQWKPSSTHDVAINTSFRFPITINIR